MYASALFCTAITIAIARLAARVIATTQGIKGGPADNMADFTIADCNNRCSTLRQLPSHRLYAANICG
jgi:hypothetical protein